MLLHWFLFSEWFDTFFFLYVHWKSIARSRQEVLDWTWLLIIKCAIKMIGHLTCKLEIDGGCKKKKGVQDLNLSCQSDLNLLWKLECDFAHTGQ